MNLIQLLTNENLLLIFLVSIPISIIEWILFLKTSSIILNLNITRKNKFLFIFLNTILSIFINIFRNDLVKDILNIAQFVLSLHIIFKQSIKNSFLALILSYMVVAISGYLSQTILMTIINIDIQGLTSIPLYYSLSCLLSSLLWFVFIVILDFIKRNKKITFFDMNLKNFVTTNLILGIVTIALVSYLSSTYWSTIPFELTLLVIISLIVYFLISMYSLLRTKILEETKENLDNEIAYNKTLSLLHDNIRGFKHDFNNIVQSIGGYLALNDIDGLKLYYEKLLNDCKVTNNLNLLNPESINNPPIYSLLTNKYFLATEKGIIMNFSIFSNLSKIGTHMYELSRILGILLDNAIEAAEETNEKKVEIEIRSDDKKQLFIIKNSCKDSNISTTQIFEKGYSTKNRNTGLGLWNVHKILAKNTNLDLFTTVNNNVFCQQLAIYN